MLFLLNMCFALKVLLLLLSQKELGRVWAKDQPGHWYNVEHQDKWPRLDVQTNRAQRSTSGHAMFNREVLGGDLTINTLPDNMTDLEDSEKYYTWRSFGPEDQRTHELWVDMNDLQHGQVRMHGILSNTHKQAARVALSFDFPFYGHYLRQVTIATGGFIFMGDVTHRMLTATQYIAPLMANFDPSYSKESTVQYLDNGDVFVVQWEKVRLRGRESEGAFTFQTALYRTGTITFSYKDIPLPVKVINSPEHPVKAGLSDGLMVLLPSPQALDIQGRAIFEYHRIEIDVRKITNHSAFEFTALATCLQHKSCEACLSSNQTSGCSWCNVLQRCSDGTDRHRQEWLDYNCSEEGRNVTCEEYSRGEIDSFTDPYSTSYSGTPTAVSPQRNGCETNDDSKNEILLNGNDLKTSASKNKEMLANTGVIAGVVAAVVLLSAMILLALYINSHPNAASPLYLIQRRNNFWTSMTFRKKGLQPSYTEVEGDGHERDSIVEAGPC